MFDMSGETLNEQRSIATEVEFIEVLFSDSGAMAKRGAKVSTMEYWLSGS